MIRWSAVTANISLWHFPAETLFWTYLQNMMLNHLYLCVNTSHIKFYLLLFLLSLSKNDLLSFQLAGIMYNTVSLVTSSGNNRQWPDQMHLSTLKTNFCSIYLISWCNKILNHFAKTIFFMFNKLYFTTLSNLF